MYKCKNKDSDDDQAYLGEQKEVDKEMDELRVAEHWVNQKGWDTEGDALTTSPSSGRTINLRLDWGAVQKKLEQGAGAVTSGSAQVLEDVVLRDYSLDNLDPTQRAFADRVLKWVAEIVRVYKDRGAGHRRTARHSVAAVFSRRLRWQRQAYNPESSCAARASPYPARRHRC